jgi:hypothetical protein
VSWKSEVKESILQHAMTNGRWTQHGHLSAKMVYEHAHSCQPDVGKSSFASDRVSDGDVDSIQDAIKATITCTCGALTDEVFVIVMSTADLLAAILN